MKKITCMLYTLCLCVAGITASYAQTNAEKGPHGGEIQVAGQYKIEMVRSHNTISFYLLDGKGTVLSNKGITGTITFEFTNSTQATSSLTNTDQNAFQIGMPKTNIFSNCIVSFTVEGKTVTAKFTNAVSPHDIEHGHQH